MKKVKVGLLALCLLLLCSCGADVASPSPSHRGTLPSQKPSQAPVQTQEIEPEESDAFVEFETPTLEPTPEPTP